jgi:hypothetical protein
VDIKKGRGTFLFTIWVYYEKIFSSSTLVTKLGRKSTLITNEQTDRRHIRVGAPKPSCPPKEHLWFLIQGRLMVATGLLKKWGGGAQEFFMTAFEYGP